MTRVRVYDAHHAEIAKMALDAQTNDAGPILDAIQKAIADSGAGLSQAFSARAEDESGEGIWIIVPRKKGANS
jgi:hypothetical protein